MSNNEIDDLYFKTLADVQNEEFDYIIIGAGAYGTSFAHRMLELAPQCKILLFDKGGYLIPEHIQNLPPAYVDLNTKVGVRPWKSTGDMDFMPQIPYVGGRALFWNAWIPQPTESEMPEWPSSVINELSAQWYPASEFMGRRYSLTTPGNDDAPLHKAIRHRLFAGLDRIGTAVPCSNPSDLDSSMAAGQNVSSQQWAKFSPINVLIDDLYTYSGRLTVVSNCEVLRTIADDSSASVSSIETVQGTLQVKGAKIILALSTLEAAALAIRSFPDNPLLGKNLSGHIRSWLAVRVPKSKVPGVRDRLEVSALYLPGRSQAGRLMHTHITAAYNPHPKKDMDILYKVLPDASTRQAVETYQDPNYVVFMLHAMGEFLGEATLQSWNYVSVENSQMIVHVKLRPEDEQFWQIMDRTIYEIVEVLTDNASVEFQQSDGGWSSSPPATIRNVGLVHESGTLWMGEDPKTSVTDLNGRLHAVDNVYGTGGMLFPRPGSWNPTLTGIAMAFRLARHFVTCTASSRA